MVIGGDAKRKTELEWNLEIPYNPRLYVLMCLLQSRHRWRVETPNQTTHAALG
jgi:hypothetical protein